MRTDASLNYWYILLSWSCCCIKNVYLLLCTTLILQQKVLLKKYPSFKQENSKKTQSQSSKSKTDANFVHVIDLHPLVQYLSWGVLKMLVFVTQSEHQIWVSFFAFVLHRNWRCTMSSPLATPWPSLAEFTAWHLRKPRHAWTFSLTSWIYLRRPAWSEILGKNHIWCSSWPDRMISKSNE